MVNVNTLLIEVMKKQVFAISDLMNKSARQVLSEIKTKYKDIREEITPEIQYKILTKMLNDRIKSAEIYKKANRPDLEEKERTEIFVIEKLLEDVKKDLPKELSESEILEKIRNIIIANSNYNIGMIMKEFKDLPVDKAKVSKLAKDLINQSTSTLNA